MSIHQQSTHPSTSEPVDSLRILAIDAGAGTQDVLVYDSSQSPENCFKLVLPSQTRIVGRRIREVTRRGRALHLTGSVMGGGESSSAVADHLAAGLRVTATEAAARTIHNNLDRVCALGIEIVEFAPSGSEVVELRDVDLDALAKALALFGVEMPDIVAVAVQDHGFRPGSANNDVRFEYLQALVENGGALEQTIFEVPPDGMTRMAAVTAAIPGAYVMDTGAAAVLGSLGDPAVSRAARDEGVVLVNIGNMHTFATLVKDRRLFGLFEHHTGGITAEIIDELVGRLRTGAIDGATFRSEFDGHGAALDPEYRKHGPFEFVAITGPNRAIARSLGYHEAAPHGDMMLTGAFGLVEGVLMRQAAAGRGPARTLSAF